jgi:hypothetical protein
MAVNMLVPFVHIVGALLLFVSLGVEWVAVAGSAGLRHFAGPSGG